MSSHRTGVKCGRSVMLTMMLTGLAMLLKSICVVALYEDQASLWDWKQSYVGKVQFVWPSQQNGHHQLVIATESSVIAALNIRNGTLSWRKSMEITNGLQAVTHLSHANTQPSGELLTVTSNGRYIRSWNVHKGFLNWERRLPVELIELESQQEAKWLFQADSASSRLAIARFTQSEQNDVQLQSYTFDYLHDTLTAAAQHVTFKLMDWTSFERKCKFVSLQAIACLSNDRIQVIWLNSGRVLSIDFVQFGLTLMEEVPPLRIVAFNEQPFADSILFGLSNGYEVFYVLNVNSNQLLSYQTLFNTESATVQKMGDKHVLFAVTHEVKGAPNEFHVKTYIWKNDKDWAPNHDLDATFVVKNVRQDILVESLFVIPLKKTAGRLAYKIAFTSPDAQFVLPTSKNSTLGWVREESLSCVLAADIVDLPLSDLDENIESALESAESDLISQFLKRLHLQVSQFQLYLKALTQPSTIKTIANSETLQFGYAKQERTSSVLMRDQFGLHKAIVMLTKYGKLIALDTISGKIIWTLYDAQLADSLHKQLQQDKAVHDIRQARKVTLFIQRTTSHHPFQAVCTILLQNGYLFSFDPITGRKLDTTQLPSRPKQIMMLSHVNKDNLKGILILDQENHVQTYPDYVYNDVFLAVKEKYFMMVVQSSTGLVQGFSFDKCDHQQRRASPVWSFTIPISKPTANKLSVHFKPQFEQVHSLGRVLGDRNVLYKYLNPNLVAIVNEEPDTNVTSSESALGDYHTVTVYLIDAVNGQLVYSSYHRRARNVFTVHSENSLVYSFYNEKQRRTEINAIDLYEGPTMANFSAFSSLNRPFYVQPAVVHHNSFVFPTGITAMSDTKTEKGLTNKHLIIALPYGGILSLPKVFVDPRRPINPTMDHREEGLLQYMPELPIPAEGMINYNQSVINVNGIISVPATLESTSLVLVHGIDLFYTRVTPSKTFDILKEDFDHWLIVAVLFTLIVLYYLSKYFANQKTLHNAWK